MSEKPIIGITMGDPASIGPQDGYIAKRHAMTIHEARQIVDDRTGHAAAGGAEQHDREQSSSPGHVLARR